MKEETKQYFKILAILCVALFWILAAFFGLQGCSAAENRQRELKQACAPAVYGFKKARGEEVWREAHYKWLRSGGESSCPQAEKVDWFIELHRSSPSRCPLGWIGCSSDMGELGLHRVFYTELDLDQLERHNITLEQGLTHEAFHIMAWLTLPIQSKNHHDHFRDRRRIWW